MLDFQHIALLRQAAAAERELAADHDRAALDNPDRAEAAKTCRLRADAYERRAARAEIQLEREAHS